MMAAVRGHGPVLMLALAALGLLALSMLIGSSAMPLSRALDGMARQDAAAALIVWEIRLPRAVMAWSVGFALGLSGAALQGLLRNPLAGPGVLGVSSSAALGAVVAIYFGLASVGGWAVPLAGMIGAGAATVLLIALGGAGMDPVRLVLIGVGVNALAGALTALAMNLAPNPYALSDLVNWLLGSVENRSWADVVRALPGMAAGTAVLLVAARGLSALSLGREVAVTLGTSPALTSRLVIAGSAMLCGTAVALAGTIGFVGLVAPHLVRPLVRSDPGALLIPAGLAGGMMLLLADTALRVVPGLEAMKLGVIVALVGAPAFIWIAGRLARGWRG